LNRRDREVGVKQLATADVIVRADRDPAMIVRCVASILENSGPILDRLIVVDDRRSELEIAEQLTRSRINDPRVQVLPSSTELGLVASWNYGLAARKADAVLLATDCAVGRDWLGELAAVAHSDERTSGVSPLTDGCKAFSLIEIDRGVPFEMASPARVRQACAGLPRWTLAPTLCGSCVYLRGDVLDAVGLFESGLTSGVAAIDDWVMRAQDLGFTAKRANRVYVQRADLVALHAHSMNVADQTESVVDPRHKHLQQQVEEFHGTLDGQLALHAVRIETTGKLRIGYDIRHLGQELVGTRTYAVSLGKALAELPGIELTLLVRHPDQARGLKGRVVVQEQWRDDVAVIHKPSQVIDVSELGLLFKSSAHVVLTYQDLIGYRIRAVFPIDEGFERYRTTSALTLQAVQRVLAYSQSAAGEITAEFGIPPEEIAVVPLGVDAEWFGKQDECDLSVSRRLRLPRSYFFSLATDYPHKNLPNLLDAYALLRRRWPDQDPPGLVLAGYTSGARTDFYPGLESEALARGLSFLGPVSSGQLRVLYRHALALVFPSLYEGFGLPPLEAMACGTPVIAMPVSSVPEVGGDCVLYPEGLSTRDLAHAMESLAADAKLREELRAAGLRRVQEFRWEKTARATLEAYRAAALQPSERSLRMRRLLQDAIILWSGSDSSSLWLGESDSGAAQRRTQSIGIRRAWRALNVALSARLRRELKRFHIPARRKTA
jgi:glycosyltransferase involved in cell wall biosynthesis/GT2 family glycosyltransferase